MLHVVHDVAVQVAQDGDTRVHLVVNPQTQTHTHVLADVQPVQVVPEALADPVLADLSTTTLGECLSRPQEYSISLVSALSDRIRGRVIISRKFIELVESGN